MSINIRSRVPLTVVKPSEVCTSALMAPILLVMVLALGTPGHAQGTPPARVAGTFGDYVWVEAGAGQGSWYVSGEWVAQLRGDTGKGEFIGSLMGVRSDLWVQQTGVDPATTTRSPHTHHVGLLDADVSAIPGGVRLTGNAIVTTNGSVLYAAVPVQVDITGGALIRFSNVKLTFLGQAIEHFGSQVYDGVVAFSR